MDLSFEDLPLVVYLKEKNTDLYSVAKAVLNNVRDALDNRIPAIFPSYTLHNTQHSFRIINYMSKLVDDYKKLSELEVAILIISALCHDVGMALSDEDRLLIMEDRFELTDAKYSVMLQLMNNDPIITMQEYVRRIHAELSAKYIRKKLKELLVIPDLISLDYCEEVAKICDSHTKGYDWIKTHLSTIEVRGNYYFNPQYIACILRMADILDIDGNRTPYRLYQLIAPKGVSDYEWRQHYVILNNEKIIVNEKTGMRQIVFHGKSKSADIHRKILSYIDWVSEELVGTLGLVATMKDQYSINIAETPVINIQPEGYSFSGYKMTLQFPAISALLMGEKIYGHRSLGLRELIQNSLDACKIRRESEVLSFGDEPYLPVISIIIDKDANVVRIKDNGIGMTIDIIKKHFLNIGVSYYKSFEFALKNFSYKPIGNYGIGFLACFMLSDHVTVLTRHYLSNLVYKIQLEKGNEWTSLTEYTDSTFFGTEVILNYKQVLEVFELKVSEFGKFVSSYFLTDEVTVKILEKNNPPLFVKNELNTELLDTTGFLKIDLSKYLKDVEGFVCIKKRKPFIRNIKELELGYEIYEYTPGFFEDDYNGSEFYHKPLLEEIDDLSNVSMDKFVMDNKITYVDIPIIDRNTQRDFDSGMEFTGDDLSEVLDKLDGGLRVITILVPKEFQEYLQKQELADPDEILEGISFDVLIDAGHIRRCHTYRFVKTIKLFEGDKNKIYLPFSENKPYDFYFPIPISFDIKQPRKMYIRGVWIRDFILSMPVMASVLDVGDVVFNVKSRQIIPDVSRNNIDKDTSEAINYAVAKAIHQAALNHFNFNNDECRALQLFIENFYPEKSKFEA